MSDPAAPTDEPTRAARTCNAFVSWWDGEYEGNCELPEDHEGDHFDGLSWFNDDRDCTDVNHNEPTSPTEEPK